LFERGDLDVPSDLDDCRVVQLAAGQAEGRVLGQGKRKAKLKANTAASERGPPAEPRLKEWSRDRLESGWLAHTQTRLAGLHVGAF
jgi:hypothetical protein